MNKLFRLTVEGHDSNWAKVKKPFYVIHRDMDEAKEYLTRNLKPNLKITKVQCLGREVSQTMFAPERRGRP